MTTKSSLVQKNSEAEISDSKPPILANSAAIYALSSSVSGFIEGVVFHPSDTVIKRLMVNKTLRPPERSFYNHYGPIILRDSYTNLTRAPLSLYSGFLNGLVYKIPQRMHKYGGASFIKPYVDDVLKPLDRYITSRDKKILTAGVTGALIGASEVWMLPLDRIKIIKQTHPHPENSWNIVKQEKWKLWKGAPITAARNLIGSTVFFGADALTKNLMGENEKSSLAEEILASFVATLASLTVSNPFDVIKTRLQSNKKETNFWQESINLIRNEKARGAFKGLPIKLVTAAPKQIFSFTLAKLLVDKINESLMPVDSTCQNKPKEPPLLSKKGFFSPPSNQSEVSSEVTPEPVGSPFN